MRAPFVLLGTMAIAAAWAQPARAQDPAAPNGVAAVVTQLVAADVYLSALDTHAPAPLVAGDSLDVRFGTLGARGVLVASSGVRLVVRLAPGIRPALGDTVVLRSGARLQTADSDSVAPGALRPEPVPTPVAAPVAARTALPTAARPPMSVTGRLGLSTSAIHSAGRWAEAEEAWSRTDATPAARAYLRIEHLPGDVRLTLNGRADRRFDLEESGTSADVKARIYEAHVERRFTRLPVHLRAGRFRNPYESFSDPLDGVLMRWDVGGGFGAGAVGGFRTRWSEAVLSTELPVARAFIDYDWSGSDAFVHAAFSGGQEWPDSGGSRTMAATQQALGWGPARVSSELRAARAPAGSWALSEMQVAGTLRPVDRLRLSLRYAHSGDAWSWAGWQMGDARRRAGAGVGWTGARVSGGADVAFSRTEPRDPAEESRSGRTASAWAQLDRTVAGVSPGLSATWWQDDDERAVVQIAPSLLVPFGEGRVRAEYRWERADLKGTLASPDLPAQTMITHGVSASMSIPFGAFYLQLSGDHRTGGGIATTRIYTGLEARLR